MYDFRCKNHGYFLCTAGMIPPSPPANDSEDRDSGDDDSKPSASDQDPNIRFHVTLEEGDEDSVAAMWRKLVGWCRKLGEKVNSWWRTKQWEKMNKQLTSSPGRMPLAKKLFSPKSTCVSLCICVCVCVCVYGNYPKRFFLSLYKKYFKKIIIINK